MLHFPEVASFVREADAGNCIDKSFWFKNGAVDFLKPASNRSPARWQRDETRRSSKEGEAIVLTLREFPELERLASAGVDRNVST